jgi:DNA-binding NtrC family response regulator
MESNQEKRILVIAESADTGQLYQLMLESGGYISKVCRDIRKVFELTTKSHPHLLIWHLNPLSFETTLEILSEIRQMYDEDKRPVILLSVPTDWFNSQIEAVVDRILEFLVEPEYFIRVVEDLLQKTKH